MPQDGIDRQHSITVAHEDRQAVVWVQHALALSHHSLAERPEELPAQLTGRFVGFRQTSVQRLLNDVAARTDWPWLRSTREAMTPPGGPELRALVGHKEEVTCLAVTHDGKRAVSGSADRTLRVWDLAGRTPPLVLEGHLNRVSHVAVTPDGRRAVSASWDHTVRVWSLAGNAEHVVLQGHAAMVLHVAVNADFTRAVSASWDRTLRVWDLSGRRPPVVLKGHAGPVRHVVLTSDGKRAVSGSADRTVRIWDLETARQQRVLEGHTEEVSHVAIAADGRIVSASKDGTLRVWDINTGACVILQGHRDWVVEVVVTPDGQRAVSASHDRTVRVWDLSGGTAPIVLTGHREPVIGVQLLGASRLATASGDGTMCVWDLAGLAEPIVFRGHTGPLRSLASTVDGSRVLTGAGDTEFTIRVWDVGREPIRSSRHWQSGAAFAITPDTQWAISSAWKGRPIYLWNLAEAKGPQAIEGATGLGSRVEISSDGLHAAWIESDGKSLRYLDLAGAGEPSPFGAIADNWTRLVLVGDGTIVAAVTSGGHVLCWELEDGQPCTMMAGRHANGGVFHLAASADGKQVVSVSSDTEGSVRFWDLTERRHYCDLYGDTDRVTALALSTDGRRAVTVTWDATLTIWDSVTRRATTLSTSSLAQRAVAVNGDATLAVTGSVDASVRVWDLVRQTEPVVLEGHTAEVTGTVLTLDERHAVSASLDGTLRVWHLGSAGRGAKLVACFTNDAATSFSAPHVGPTCIVVADALGRLHLLRYVEPPSSGPY